ncbi:MAG: hypothetical protein MHPSP_004555, partial [Paramarteilia canceri]
DLSSFKKSLDNKIQLFDTKVIAKSRNLEKQTKDKTSLEALNLHETVKTTEFESGLEIKSDENKESLALHNAGYDSFITGKAFIKQVQENFGKNPDFNFLRNDLKKFSNKYLVFDIFA